MPCGTWPASDIILPAHNRARRLRVFPSPLLGAPFLLCLRQTAAWTASVLKTVSQRVDHANQCAQPSRPIKKRMMRGPSYSIFALDFACIANVSQAKSSDPWRSHNLVT